MEKWTRHKMLKWPLFLTSDQCMAWGKWRCGNNAAKCFGTCLCINNAAVTLVNSQNGSGMRMFVVPTHFDEASSKSDNRFAPSDTVFFLSTGSFSQTVLFYLASIFIQIVQWTRNFSRLLEVHEHFEIQSIFRQTMFSVHMHAGEARISTSPRSCRLREWQ